MKIQILNPNNYSLPIGIEDQFNYIYQLFCENFFLKKYEIEVAIVDEHVIRELNCQYRNKDYATDVLSFPLDPIDSENLLGAIYFCYPVIEKNNLNLDYELCFLFIHSLLHLIGYSHGGEMFSLQDRIVDKVFYERNR